MDSFINFFLAPRFSCFFISVSFAKEYNRGVQGAGAWGLEVTVGSNLRGATCKGRGGGLVDPAGSVCVFFFN